MGSVFANSRNLEGIDIISREDRGADESRRELQYDAYARYVKETAEYEKWLAGNGIDRGGKFAARKARAEVTAKRRAFLLENYPNDIETDRTIEYADGEELLRPVDIKRNKTKIVIHHTA